MTRRELDKKPNERVITKSIKYRRNNLREPLVEQGNTKTRKPIQPQQTQLEKKGIRKAHFAPHTTKRFTKTERTERVRKKQNPGNKKKKLPDGRCYS